MTVEHKSLGFEDSTSSDAAHKSMKVNYDNTSQVLYAWILMDEDRQTILLWDHHTPGTRSPTPFWQALRTNAASARAVITQKCQMGSWSKFQKKIGTLTWERKPTHVRLPMHATSWGTVQHRCGLKFKTEKSDFATIWQSQCPEVSLDLSISGR